MITRNKSTLHVLMVVATYFPYIGGLETHVYEVAWRLAKVGMQVTVLTTDPSGQLPPVEKLRGVEIIRVPAWPVNKDYYFAPAIYKIITQRKWDIIHCQGYHTLVPPLAMFAAQRANIPYVVTFHSGGDTSLFRKTMRGVQRMALRPLLANASRLIGVSRFEADYLRELLHLPRKQFGVISNGATLPALAQFSPGTSPQKLIVSVGRLERYKGHQRLITALPKIRKSCSDVRLLILGTGPYEGALRELANKVNVAKYVEIRSVPGSDRRAMAEILSQAACVALLSEYESQGIAVLEALALRCPVLVTYTSALQEFVDSGLARGVSLQSTPEEVAKAVVSQLLDPLVPINFELPTWDDCATELLDLYRSIVEERSSCAS